MAKSNSLVDDLFENKTLMVIGGGILAYFIIVKPLLVKVGLAKSSDQIRNDTAATNESAWNPNFWKTGTTGTLLLHQADADNYAEIIYNYFGVFNDDYNSVLGVIKSCRTKSQVSFIAYAFLQKYNKDMYSWLRKPDGIDPLDGLSDDHLAELNNYVSKLPPYIA
jgi:hypothetical protein